MVTTRVHVLADGNYWWEDYAEPTDDVLERYVGADPSHVNVQIVDLTTGATLWSNDDTYAVNRAADAERLRGPYDHARARDVIPRLRLPSPLTCARVAIGLIALVGFVSHLRGGGAHPCTCAP